MFDIIKDIISFTGDFSTSYNGYIIQGCVALIVLSCVVCVDFIFKVFLSLMARKDK